MPRAAPSTSTRLVSFVQRSAAAILYEVSSFEPAMREMGDIVVETAADGIITIDENGIIDSNPAGEEQQRQPGEMHLDKGCRRERRPLRVEPSPHSYAYGIGAG